MPCQHPDFRNFTCILQTLWQLAAVVKSQVSQRKAAAMNVLHAAERKVKSAEVWVQQLLIQPA